MQMMTKAKAKTKTREKAVATATTTTTRGIRQGAAAKGRQQRKEQTRMDTWLLRPTWRLLLQTRRRQLQRTRTVDDVYYYSHSHRRCRTRRGCPGAAPPTPGACKEVRTQCTHTYLSSIYLSINRTNERTNEQTNAPVAIAAATKPHGDNRPTTPVHKYVLSHLSFF